MSDIIDARNLVYKLKERCNQHDISNETLYPTTRNLLMHSALILEEKVLNEHPDTVGYFFTHSQFINSTLIEVIRHGDVLIKMTDLGKLRDNCRMDILNLKIDYLCITEFMPSPNTDILYPLLEIHVE